MAGSAWSANASSTSPAPGSRQVAAAEGPGAGVPRGVSSSRPKHGRTRPLRGRRARRSRRSRGASARARGLDGPGSRPRRPTRPSTRRAGRGRRRRGTPPPRPGSAHGSAMAVGDTSNAVTRWPRRAASSASSPRPQPTTIARPGGGAAADASHRPHGRRARDSPTAAGRGRAGLGVHLLEGLVRRRTLAGGYPRVGRLPGGALRRGRPAPPGHPHRRCRRRGGAARCRRPARARG